MDQISPLESENQNPLRNHLFSAYLKFSLKNTGSYTKNIRSDSVGLKGLIIKKYIISNDNGSPLKKKVWPL